MKKIKTNLIIVAAFLLFLSVSYNCGKDSLKPVENHKNAEIRIPKTPNSLRAWGMQSLNQWRTDTEVEPDLNISDDLGSTWERVIVHWYQIQEAGPDSYRWGLLDDLVNRVKAHGKKILLQLQATPVWARPAGAPSTDAGIFYPPTDTAYVSRFIRQLVLRYLPQGITTYEIWNEPNISFWKDSPANPKPNPVRYTEMLIAAAKAARCAAASLSLNVRIVSAGLAPGQDLADGSQILAPTFLQKMYDAGARDYFDALGHHPYSYTRLPSQSNPYNGWTQLTTLRSLMNANGGSDKLIWLTEFGAPTAGSYSVSEARQDSIYSDAIRLYNQTEGLGPIFIYTRRDYNKDVAGQPPNPENHFGLVRIDSSHKPAYQTVKNAMHAANP